MLALAATLPIACGDDGSPSPAGPQRLSGGEESIISRAQAAVRSYCRKIGLYITRREPLPTASETGQVNAELDRLIALAREKPGAQTGRRETLRDVLGAMIEDLQGANCSGALERKLEQAYATLP